MRAATFAFVLGLTTAAAVAEPADIPYAHIDQHALSTPPLVERSLDTLAQHLVEPAGDEREKARAIFRWITDRIRFDMDAYATEHPGQTKAEGVLRTRKAVCYGYAALFEALATRAGLTVISIPGYAKGVGFFDETVDPPQARYRVNHMWNAVQVGGRWHFIDATRGAGYIKRQLFHKAFQEQYFLTPPEQLVRTHLPGDPRWQLLPTPLSHAQFEALPYVDMGYLRMGMKAGASHGVPSSPGLHTNLDMYAKYGWMKVLSAPANAGPLPPGRPYYFLIDAPAAVEVAVTQGPHTIPLKKVGTRFEGAIQPQPGVMQLSMRRHPQAPFESVVDYQVGNYPGYVPSSPPQPERTAPWRKLLDRFGR